MDISNVPAETWKNAHHYKPSVQRPAFETKPGSMGKQDLSSSPARRVRTFPAKRKATYRYRHPLPRCS